MALPNRTELHQLLSEIETTVGPDFYADKTALEADLELQRTEHADLGVKILTIFGGILGSLFLVGFMFMIRIMESPGAMLFLGILLVGGALFFSRMAKSIILETSVVCAYLIGLVLFGVGAAEYLNLDENILYLLMLLGVITFLISDKPVLIFLGFLLFTGSLAGLIIVHKFYILLHVLVAFTAVGFTWLCLNEAWFITRHIRLNLAFGPGRMGLLLTLLSLLLLLAHPQTTDFYTPHPWISTVALLACLTVVIYKILALFQVTNQVYRLVIPVGLAMLFLPTLYVPAIAGAILVLVVSFYSGHRAGSGFGAIALIYFVILFYYDLNLTLLTKSAILMANGALFLIGYFLIHKKLKPYAEV